MKKPTVKQMKRRPSLWWAGYDILWIAYPNGEVIFFENDEWQPSIWSNRFPKIIEQKIFLGWV